MAIESRLKKIRLEKGVSQEELAVEAGVTARFIGFLESGDRKPSIDVAFKIANKLGVQVEDIFLPLNCTKCT